MDPDEELLKNQPSPSEFENNTEDVRPEEAEKISGGGMGPYADYSGS